MSKTLKMIVHELPRTLGEINHKLLLADLKLALKEVEKLEQQLQQARRQGWEQCQREVVKNILNAADPNILIQPSFTYRGIANMIASMEYKMEANDESV